MDHDGNTEKIQFPCRPCRRRPVGKLAEKDPILLFFSRDVDDYDVHTDESDIRDAMLLSLRPVVPRHTRGHRKKKILLYHLSFRG